MNADFFVKPSLSNLVVHLDGLPPETDRHCFRYVSRKRKYLRRREATHDAKWLGKRIGLGRSAHVFLCPFCETWHVGDRRLRVRVPDAAAS